MDISMGKLIGLVKKLGGGQGAGGGGGGQDGVFYVTIASNGGGYTADKPYAEVAAAIENGKHVVLREEIQNGIYAYYHLDSYQKNDYINFTTIVADPHNIIAYLVGYGVNGNVIFEERQYDITAN